MPQQAYLWGVVFVALALPGIFANSPRNSATFESGQVQLAHSASASSGSGTASLAPPHDAAKHLDPLVPPLVLGAPSTEIRTQGVLPTVLWTDEFDADERAHFHPHGSQYCASGCTVHNHPTRDLTPGEFRKLLEQYGREPAEASSLPLDSLLYYGRQTQRLIDRVGTPGLSDAHAAVLRRELRRTHARIAIRVVDEFGEIRAWLPPTRVPLDRRHVFDMEVQNVLPLVTSGTVKRVGQHHLWHRL